MHVPDMNEKSQPLRNQIQVFGFVFGRHIQCALTYKRLGIRRHIGEVVGQHEHLHHSSERIKQGHLNRSHFRYVVAFFAQTYMSLKIHIKVVKTKTKI